MGLTAFQDYFTWLLSTIADFLLKPPIFWVFGLIIFCFILKIFKELFFLRY